MKTSTKAVFAATALLFAAMPLFASAAIIKTGQLTAIPQTERVAQNAYLAGGQVNFSSTAQKDLVAAGGDVTVNGPVWGDALLAGGTVQVLQEVRGDVRALGGQVTIGNDVRGDLVVAGGNVTVLPGTVIAGDVIVAGGKVDLEGSVSGSVRAYGGDVTVDGTVAGPVIIHAARTVTFGDKAVMGKSLWYSSPQAAHVASGAKLGNDITYVKGEAGIPHAPGFAGIATFFSFLVLAKFAGTLTAVLVLVLAWQKLAGELAAETLGSFWKKAGIGFIALIVTPVAAIVLLLSVIGSYLAFLLGALYALALIAAGIYMCVVAGALLSQWTQKEASTDWKWAVLGTLVVFIIAFIPFIGWLADFILFLAALGTLVTNCWKHAEARR